MKRILLVGCGAPPISNARRCCGMLRAFPEDGGRGRRRGPKADHCRQEHKQLIGQPPGRAIVYVGLPHDLLKMHGNGHVDHAYLSVLLKEGDERGDSPLAHLVCERP